MFWVVLTLILTSSIGFYYKDFVVNFVVAPLHGEKLIYLTPGGGFSFIFTVCLYFGALLTIPVIIYHIYRFLQPVLGKTSRRLIIALVTLSGLLAASGALFGYLVAIPAAITFLMTFAGDAVAPSLTAESYLGFVVAYMLGLAALFQLPLLLFMFDHVKPFPPGALLSSQRFVIVGAVIAAAIITPTPDIVNQLVIAAPIIVIYQLGAIAVYMRRKARDKAVSRYRTRSAATAEVIDIDVAVLNSVVDNPVGITQKPDQVNGSVAASASRSTPRSVDGMARSSASRNSFSVPARSVRTAARTTATVRQVTTIKQPTTQGVENNRTTDGFFTARQNS